MQVIKLLIEGWKKYAKPFFQDPLLLNKWHEPDILGRRDEGRITERINSGYRTLTGKHDYVGDVFMFEQDMSQLIMPLRGRRGDGRYSARLEPDNALEGIVARAFGSERHGDLSEALNDFIREVTQSLFYYGSAAFEVYCKRDESGNIIRLDFYHVYAPSIKKIFGNYWQLISWGVAKQFRIKVGMHRISSERMLYIDFPTALGGRRSLKKIVRELAFIGHELLPEFHLKAMRYQDDTGFSFNEFIWDSYLAKGKMTRKFGWNQRKVPDDDMLEYYTIHRHLVFKKSQAILREHILNEINGVLRNKYVNSGSRIVVDGLLKPEELDKELQALCKGDLEFNKIIERTQD